MLNGKKKEKKSIVNESSPLIASEFKSSFDPDPVKKDGEKQKLNQKKIFSWILENSKRVILLFIVVVFFCFGGEFSSWFCEEYEFENFYFLSWITVSSLMFCFPIYFLICIFDFLKSLFVKKDTEEKKENKENKEIEMEHNKEQKEQKETKETKKDEKEEEEKGVELWRIVCVSVMTSIIELVLNYFNYQGVVYCPPSLNILISMCDAAMSFMTSVLLFIPEVFEFFFFRVGALLVLVSGVVLIGLGKMADDSSLSDYPNYNLGVVFTIIGTYSGCIGDLLYIRTIGSRLNLKNFFLYGGCVGLSCCVLNIWPMFLLQKGGIEPDWSFLARKDLPIMILFFGIIAFSQFTYFVSNGILLKFVGSPIIICVICNLAEVFIMVFFDHFVSGLNYSAILICGAILAVIGGTAYSLIEALPSKWSFLENFIIKKSKEIYGKLFSCSKKKSLTPTKEIPIPDKTTLILISKKKKGISG